MQKPNGKILIFDFGGQYAHLIARRVKVLGYQAQIVPSSYSIHKVLSDSNIKGLILSGGARSVYEKNAPKFDNKILSLNLPTLGICYGHQVIAHALGGKVISGQKGEYGLTSLKITNTSPLFAGLSPNQLVWMNHRDSVVKLPVGFTILAKTANTAVAAFANAERRIYGVQFHPEVTHTAGGQKMLKNFLKQAAPPSLSAATEIADIVREAKTITNKEKAIVGLSGGVDSAVAAVCVSRAIGKKLLAVYVDTGLMRAGETAQIKKTFKKFPLRLKIVQAEKLYFKALGGVTDPETKRKIIGKLFIQIFEKEARRFGAKFLIQGTIYSDRIESGLTKYASAIKSHHNVGGLPKNLKIKIYEPLRELYKDEVRRLAKKLGLPPTLANRQVFPGPGLAIRMLGEVTKEKAEIVRQADVIIQAELKKSGWLKKIWMAFPVLLPLKSVGVQGDERTYKSPLVLRIVESQDAMTANFSKIPYEILEKISSRITNEIKSINRVVYDISNKPPATMEWE